MKLLAFTWLVFVATTTGAQAQELGRLFFTPEQRSARAGLANRQVTIR